MSGAAAVGWPPVVTVGETMASLRADGPIRLGGNLRLSVAGSESTVAIGLARLGVAAAWVGVLGDDELGALILRTLRAEQVDVSGCRVAAGGPTGMMVIEPRLGHVARVTYRRAGSAGSTIGPDDIRSALARSPRWMHLSGITPALSPTAREAVEWACETASSAGTSICFDVNYRAALWSRADARAVLGPLAAGVRLLVASADELELVSPSPTGSEEQQASALLAEGVEEVVVTRGAAGASVYTAGEVLHRPARRVPVVDTVGAGDAFTAGYLAGVLDGAGPASSLELALATSAFAVSCAGDWEGLPTRRELALLDAEAGATLR